MRAAAPDLARRIVEWSRHHRARSAGQWVLFIGVSALALRPVLTTSIVADDFYALFYTQKQGGGSVAKAFSIGLDGASLGHFNYLGQVIGAITAWMWIHLSFQLGIRFSLVFAVTKLLVYLFVVLSASRFARKALTLGGIPISTWRARTYVTVALFGTLQIHVPWSNDPTGSYPMAGFASTGVGFLVLAAAVDLFSTPTWRTSIGLGILASAGVLYYEINVAAAIALLPPMLILALRREAGGDGEGEGARSWRTAGIALVPMAMPALATIAFRFATRPEPGGFEYSGTTISTDDTLLPSFGRALVSSLPGSAWKLSRDWLDAPIWIRTTPVLLLIAFAIVLGVAANRTPARTDDRLTQPRVFGALLAMPLIYWIVATAIQIATPKVRSESPGIGYVYNYYAIGATVIAVVIALGGAVIGPRIRPGLRPAVLPVVVAIVSIQFLIGWNIRARLAEITLPNAALLSAYADELPVERRCEALLNWSNGAWPEYYEHGVVDGIQSASIEYRGEPFCDDPTIGAG